MEVLGPQLTRTEIGKKNDEEIKKMTPKEKQEWEKRCDKNYRKILKMLHKK